MFILRLFALTMLIGLVAAPALAATPEGVVAACQPQGAYGQTFGVTEAVGAPLPPEPGEELVVAAPAALAPFERVAMALSLGRREIFAIGVTGHLPSEAEGAALKAALEQAAVADGRFGWAGPENNALRATFDSVPPDQTVASGLRLEIMALGRWVSVTCVDRARFVEAFREAIGGGLDGSRK